MATGPTLGNGGIVYYTDANANATLDAGERAVIYGPTTQHYYELINAGAPLGLGHGRASGRRQGRAPDDG